MLNSALELKVNKQKKHLSLTVQKTFHFSQNSSAALHRVTFDHSTSYVLLIDKPNKSCKNAKKRKKEMPYPPQKKLLKRKENNITPAKLNSPISQTSSGHQN